MSSGLKVRRPDLMDVERTGTVRWFKPEKGYGRITADDGEVLFVHFSSIVMEGYKELQEGQRVRFAWRGCVGGPRPARRRERGCPGAGG